MGPAPFVLVQRLDTEWTKASRGGQGAVRRNGTPLGLPVPSFFGFHSDEFCFRIHRLRFSEQTGFAPTETAEVQGDPVWREGCVVLAQEAEVVRVRFEYIPGSGGAPAREMFDPSGDRLPLSEEAFTLRLGEWGRVSYNGRFSCVDTGNWWYTKVVCNVGLSLRPAPDWFTQGAPDHVYTRMAELW
jgi:hypothetical protein